MSTKEAYVQDTTKKEIANNFDICYRISMIEAIYRGSYVSFHNV